jgi:hypothetical protein
MRRQKFKGIVMPDVRPLDQRERPLNSRKGMNKSDELEKPAPAEDQEEIDSLAPEYAKKYLRSEKRVKPVVQLKLWGNPYDTNY